jgi:hypothetical protein
MEQTILGKSVGVIAPTNLYKWHRTWGKIQKNFYPEPVYLRREKQIEDFVLLNEFENLYIEKDTDILRNFFSVTCPNDADLIIITDQKFSRLPCNALIDRMLALLDQCPRMFVCLNRHYINIDSTYIDKSLSSHYPLAITQWLRKSLPNAKILDLSLDVVDRGDWFTWVVPDRMYYIEQS